MRNCHHSHAAQLMLLLRWLAVVTCLWLGGRQTVCGQNSLFPLTENYLLDTWRLEELLPDSTVTDIAQTPDDYLWFGSFEGLIRFDGNRFVLFSPKNTKELLYPWIPALITDQAGALWIGGEKRPARLKQGRWDELPLLPRMQGQTVRSFARNAHGQLFLGTYSNLFVYQAGQFQEIPVAPGRGKVQLAVDTRDQLWLAREYELYHWQDGQMRQVLNFPPERKIRCIAPAKNGGLWLADNFEIRRWTEGGWTQQFPIPTNFSENVSSLYEDRQGSLWAAFFGHGLRCYYPDGKTGYCTIQEGLLNDALRTVFEDRDGNIWVSSNGGGVARLKKRSVQVYGRYQGLRQDIINSAIEIAPQRLLVSTHGGGVVPFDGRQFGKPIITSDGNPRILNWVLSSLLDSQGNIWLGTLENGLVKFRAETNGYRHLARWDTPEIDSLFEDHRGQVWAGTPNGLAQVAENQLILLTNPLPADKVLAIAEDAQRQMWVSFANQGLFNAPSNAPNEFKAYHPRGGVPMPQPLCLYGDRSGSLWIGYAGGQLGQLRDGREFWFQPAQGLPEVSFASLTEDDAGDLWAGTDSGILKITRASLIAVAAGATNRLQSRLFTQSDGLATWKCRRGYQPLSGRLKNGHLWFATMQGLATIDPRQDDVLNIPTPWIEEIALDSYSFNLPPEDDTLWEVAAGTRHVEITFTGISLSAAKRVAFEYQLQPLDATWIPVKQERKVHFRDLHPGNYRFLMRASHNGSEWSPAKSLAFVVKPFFWQTLAFKIGSLALLLGLVLAVVLQTAKRRYQRAMDLQRQIFAEEKAAQLEASNQELRKNKQDLEEALASVKTLSGLIPICANCHSIRDDKGYWERVEIYIQNKSEAKFSHGLCPNCIRKLYPNVADDVLNEPDNH